MMVYPLIVKRVPHAFSARGDSHDSELVYFRTFAGIPDAVASAVKKAGFTVVEQDATKWKSVTQWVVRAKSDLLAAMRREEIVTNTRKAALSGIDHALSHAFISRVADDNGRKYSISISLKVDEDEKEVEVATSGTMKRTNKAKMKIKDTDQMEFDFVSSRVCEECGEDISDEPEHYSLCRDCYFHN